MVLTQCLGYFSCSRGRYLRGLWFRLRALPSPRLYLWQGRWPYPGPDCFDQPRLAYDGTAIW